MQSDLFCSIPELKEGYLKRQKDRKTKTAFRRFFASFSRDLPVTRAGSAPGLVHSPAGLLHRLSGACGEGGRREAQRASEWPASGRAGRGRLGRRRGENAEFSLSPTGNGVNHGVLGAKWISQPCTVSTTGATLM